VLAACVTPMKKRALFIIISACIVVAGLFMALYTAFGSRHAESVGCGNYMSSIGCAARTWALDDEGRLPPDFRSMSNELATTKVLVCPGDHQRVAARNWALLDQTNCSYEIVAPGMSASDTTNIYFRCKVHGHLGYADGTVFDGKRRRTKVLW
jgi:hypothetical protein